MTAARRRRLRYALVVAAVLAFLAIRTATGDLPGDFGRYYEAGRTIATGHSERLYASVQILGRFEHSFRYLPIFAVVMAPLALLPIRAAFFVWQAVHLTCFALSFFFAERVARDRDRSVWWMAIPLLFVYRVFVQNLNLGQINPIVICLTLGGIWAFSRRKDGVAGLLTGAGAALKFTPALFLLVFAARGRWKAVAAQVAAILLFVVVVPSAVLGPANHVRLVREYAGNEGDLVGAEPDDAIDGQSLKAIVYHYVTPMPAMRPRRGDDPILVNVADLGPSGAFALYAAASAAVLVFLLWFCVRGGSGFPRWAFCASAGVLAMLLLSPESRRPHFAILVLPYTALTYHAIVPFLRERRRALPAFLTLLAMIAVAAPSRGLIGSHLADRVDAIGNMGLSALLLLVALWLVDRELAAAPAAEVSSAAAGGCLPDSTR